MPTERRRLAGRRTLAALLAGLAAALAPTARAGLEDLLSPGELAAAHAELDGRCGECHQAMKRSNENALCLACHEEVDADRRLAEGLHGRSGPARRSDCRSCHPEHRGREADLLGLARSSFRHRDTDFPLEGVHRRVACADCHAADARHRDAPSDCVGCHREDDVHAGALGPDCRACHDPGGWPEARFDHGRTDFALEGAHAEVACALCHPSAAYDRATPACASCHDIDDAHGGRLGPACGDCHDAGRWDRSRFDHARDTDHPLRGAHATTACASCHRQAGVAPARSCRGCHAADDVHRGQRGDDCQRCHGEDRWATRRFDHATEADWPLRGGHAQADCDDCHTAGLQVELASRCASCHARDDAHGGQLGDDCGSCHHPAGWLREVVFDHDLAAFPLLGLHAMVACAECHTTPRFRDAPGDCADCHRCDDRHEGRLGRDCRRCHNPNDWALWRFDHARSTRFALEGRHEGLRCEACHQRPGQDPARLSDECASCHRRDDVHRGGFGPDCQRCHGADDWARVHMGIGWRRGPDPPAAEPGGVQ